MHVEAYETLSHKIKVFLQHALFSHVCGRSLCIIFEYLCNREIEEKFPVISDNDNDNNNVLWLSNTVRGLFACKFVLCFITGWL